MGTDYTTLRDSALDDIRRYMDSLDPDKGKKLAYWLTDYARLLSLESSFKPEKLIRYKRGAIVKAHLGYRIGSEEGGLHYAVVLDRNNSIHSPTVTVVPLTSVKPGVDLSNLPNYKVSIGNEVYSLLTSNLNSALCAANQQINNLQKKLQEPLSEEQRKDAKEEIKNLTKQIDYCNNMNKEASKMKSGSIALVGQITTISKIRIYNPMHNRDAFSKVRVSSATLDLLDSRIKELYGSPASDI